MTVVTTGGLPDDNWDGKDRPFSRPLWECILSGSPGETVATEEAQMVLRDALIRPYRAAPKHFLPSVQERDAPIMPNTLHFMAKTIRSAISSGVYAVEERYWYPLPTPPHTKQKVFDALVAHPPLYQRIVRCWNSVVEQTTTSSDAPLTELSQAALTKAQYTYFLVNLLAATSPLAEDAHRARSPSPRRRKRPPAGSGEAERSSGQPTLAVDCKSIRRSLPPCPLKGSGQKATSDTDTGAKYRVPEVELPPVALSLRGVKKRAGPPMAPVLNREFRRIAADDWSRDATKGVGVALQDFLFGMFYVCLMWCPTTNPSNEVCPDVVEEQCTFLSKLHETAFGNGGIHQPHPEPPPASPSRPRGRQDPLDVSGAQGAKYRVVESVRHLKLLASQKCYFKVLPRRKKGNSPPSEVSAKLVVLFEARELVPVHDLLRRRTASRAADAAASPFPAPYRLVRLRWPPRLDCVWSALPRNLSPASHAVCLLPEDGLSTVAARLYDDADLAVAFKRTDFSRLRLAVMPNG
ncbi:hypothetical protein DIPPA_31266 [Diplonema papillatum]|nr:hypothetical protein DIPPA_31266 [Diplonema papillatum]|eukprot:gene12947-19965_t